jgi:hypothetical protein
MTSTMKAFFHPTKKKSKKIINPSTGKKYNKNANTPMIKAPSKKV